MIRGYYLSVDDPVTPFPVAEQWEGEPSKQLEEIIEFRAQGGDIKTQQEWSSRKMIMNFKVTEEQLEEFRTHHIACGGRTRPFYLVLDVSESPIDVLLVRKENKDFDYSYYGVGQVDGVMTRLFQYPLVVIEEVDSTVTIVE